MFNLGPTEPIIGRAEAVIECSIEELFRYLADDLFKNYPKWSPEVKELEQITPGPVKVGTEGRQVRIDLGRRTESKFKISSYEPYVRLTVIGVSDPFRCTYELEDLDSQNSTRLTFSFELLEILAFMRPFEGLIRSAINDGADQTVQNIKRLIEVSKYNKDSI